MIYALYWLSVEDFDSLDIAILRELQSDCSRSVQEIGERVEDRQARR